MSKQTCSASGARIIIYLRTHLVDTPSAWGVDIGAEYYRRIFR